MKSSPIPLDPFDIAVGTPIGHVAATPRFRSEPGAGPRVELEQVLLKALQRPPCVVAFSGGRDSSAVLAVATHVARREGLQEPIAVTRRFSDAPRTDETAWQELVISHLGIDSWEKESIDQEMDLIGPRSQSRLREYGVLFSPVSVGDEWILRHTAGGTMLDGEGGDELLDPSEHRVKPLASTLRHRRRPSRRALRACFAALSPAGGGISRDDLAEFVPWLRRPVVEEFARRLRREHLRKPFDARRSMERMLRRRIWHHVVTNRQFFAARFGAELISPLSDPCVVHQLAIVAGRLGFRNRAESLDLLCGDLLPQEIIQRRSKASFNQGVFRGYSRRFAQQWDGFGLDSDMVNPEVLRELWQGDQPHAMSALLLQAAWLASDTQGRGTESSIRTAGTPDGSAM